MTDLLKGKIALINGAATGIGQKGAEVFAREGAKVVIADINDKDGKETAAMIKRQGGEADFMHVDITSVDQIEKMIKRTVQDYGRIDTFWHNAGGSIGGHIESTTEENFDKQVDINLKAGTFGAKFAMAEMKNTGGGCIIFTASMTGLRPTPYTPAYSLTYGLVKAGLVMLVRMLTIPAAKYNIRVNAVCPGPVATPRVVAARIERSKVDGLSLEQFVKDSTARIPLGREIEREEIANAALFLASDMASAITGVSLPVDGGFTAV